MRSIWGALVLAMGMGGCFADGQVGYSAGYIGPQAVVVGQPGLVEIQPGVQVVQADYDYPVFYSDNLYWRYDGGTWYSSRWHDRGWATSYSVPARVRGIDRPYGYAHYRGGNGGYRGGNGGYRGGYGAVRPNYNGAGREYHGARAQPSRPSAPPRPAVRPHR